MKKIDQNSENFTKRYLSDFTAFELSLNGEAQTAVHKIRKKALASFEKTGFPTRKIEAWKYTDVSAKLRQDYLRKAETGALPAGAIDKISFKNGGNNIITFINGKFNIEKSNLTELPRDVIVTDFKTALSDHKEIVDKYLFREADFTDNAFIALNTAFLQDGLFVYVPKNCVIETPVQVVHINGAEDSSLHFHPRLLLIAEQNAQVTLLENFAGSTDTQYFKNMVSEIFLAENAIVNHYRFQSESQQALVISNTFVRQQQNSVYTDLNLDLGGGLVRNDINVNLSAENCESNLYGFYFAQNKQHMDNHTYMNHLKPNCNSNELYKGILNDSARAVFSGTILVEKDAQKTNAFQSNKNLLLSKNAEADSKPQLKIFADDVKCTHGATIGELDESALFYLQQRGINREQANVMLRYAFASEVLECVKNDDLKNELEETIIQLLHENF